MWLAGQLNVSGHAQPTFMDGQGVLSTRAPVYKSFKSVHKKAGEALFEDQPPNSLTWQQKFTTGHPNEEFGIYIRNYVSFIQVFKYGSFN